MARVRLRDQGAEMIINTPEMANAEIANGGRVQFATAGEYDGNFQVVVGFDGKNPIKAVEVTHRVPSIGESWSRAQVSFNGVDPVMSLHVDGDGQARTASYETHYGVEALGEPDPAIPAFISAGSLATETALPEL